MQGGEGEGEVDIGDIEIGLPIGRAFEARKQILL